VPHDEQPAMSVRYEAAVAYLDRLKFIADPAHALVVPCLSPPAASAVPPCPMAPPHARTAGPSSWPPSRSWRSDPSRPARRRRLRAPGGGPPPNGRSW
jgi:hypothetical protein